MSENKDNKEQAIREQIEFYFSNSNLPRDKFLLTLTKENEGWVPIATLATFKKVKALSQDLPAIVQALKNSQTLSVNEDGTKVKRKDDVPDAVNDLLTAQSIYAKGFAADASIDDIQKVFTPHGKVKCVRLRKYKSNGQTVQKDSAFIEFSSPEEAKNITALKIPSPVRPNEHLKLMMKSDYSNMKANEAKEKREKGKKKKVAGASDPVKDDEEKIEMKPDLIIHLTQLGEGTTRELIKDFISKTGANVGFVDFNRGKPDAWIRLKEGSKASAVVTSLTESAAQLAGQTPTAVALTGDLEKQYWQKVTDAKSANKSKKNFKSKTARKPKGKKGGKRKDDSNEADPEDEGAKPKGKKFKVADD